MDVRLRIRCSILLLACLCDPAIGMLRSAAAAESGPAREMKVMGATEREHVTLRVYESPKQAVEDHVGGVWMSSYILEGDSLKWSRALEATTGPRSGFPDQAKAVRSKLLEMRRGDFAVVDDSLISTSDRSALYVLRSSRCRVPGYPDEYSITRILIGDQDTFILMYVDRDRTTPAADHERWIQVLAKAEVRKS